MMNLNEMTSKQLKDLGKQHHIKDWWNLNKAALIEALTEILDEPKKLKKPNLKIQELTFEGKTQSIGAWAKELEIPYPTLYDRINRNGWTTEEALTIPLGGRRKKQKEA